MSREIAVGVDVGGTTFGLGLFTRAGEKLCSCEYPTPREGGPAVVFAALAEALEAALAASGVDRADLAGAGLGIPGRINPTTGVTIHVPNLTALEGLHVGAELGRVTGLPTTAGNDAFCATLGELRYGAGRAVANLAMFTLGTGIGGGIALGNRVMRGPRQVLGELGHMTIVPTGRRCSCGNFGCLEAMAGTAGILELALRKLQDGRASRLDELMGHDDRQLTPRLIAEAAQQGDAVALEVMAEVGNYVGIAITNVIICCDPDLVIVGGGIAAAGEVLFGPIRRTVEHRGRYPQFDPANVVPAELGPEAGIYGAAALVWEDNADAIPGK